MKAVLFAIVIMAIGPLMLWFEDDLASDFSLRSHKLVVAGIPTTERKCRSTAFVFNQCGFKYELNGESHRKDYRFFSLGAPKTVILLKSSQTGELTSTVGQAYFGNRILTLVVLNLMSLSAAFALFGAMLRKRRPRQSRSEPHFSTPAGTRGHGTAAPEPHGQAATRFGKRNDATFDKR